jgi:4-hydroxyacetophenone monooxygenase
VRTADGSDEQLVARAVISAVGQLNRPMTPAIPGAERFAGPAFHTAAWDDTVDLRGARVAVIGAGASGFQLVPTIAPDVARLTVYQRTAQGMAPNPRYHERVGPGVKWAVRHLPFYARWYRLALAWEVCDGAMQYNRRDPAWDGGDRSVSEMNELVRQAFTAWLEAQVSDPALLAKVVPDYPPFGKRMLQDNGSWLASLQRDNVELVRTPIDHVDADGVVTTDGTHRPADVLIYATGFKVSEVLWPMRIVGVGGAVLDEVWDGKPAAYLGITIPAFPNFFCMYGPGTNQVHGGSIVFVSECQMTYIMGCLDRLAAAGGGVVLECRRDVHDDYHARTQAELAKMVWTHPAVRSYYEHADGNVYTVLPWRSIDYWRWTRAPHDGDFVLGSTGGASASLAADTDDGEAVSCD